MTWQVLRDIKAFVGGKDLLVFAVAIALSNQLQSTLATLIDSLVMPVVSTTLGTQKLKDRSFQIPKTDIAIKWGAALNALIMFGIALVVMVEITKYITTRFVKSTSINWS